MNIRELKNMAEQISLLSKNKKVTAADLSSFIPEQNRNGILLAPKNENGNYSPDFSEREILYKVLFDMKNDLNELKKIVFGNKDLMENILFAEKLNALNIEDYKDARIVIKGCSNLPVPVNAYVELTRLLRPVAKSIMYGEPCSTVPLYKKK